MSKAMKTFVNLLSLSATIGGVFVAFNVSAFLVTRFLIDASTADAADLGASMAFSGMLLLSLPIAFFGGIAVWVLLFTDGAWRKPAMHLSEKV